MPARLLKLQTTDRVRSITATLEEEIVLGWLMKHPARVQAVVGTLDPQRIAACADAERVAVAMTRQQWYALYQTSRGQAIP